MRLDLEKTQKLSALEETLSQKLSTALEKNLKYLSAKQKKAESLSKNTSSVLRKETRSKSKDKLQRIADSISKPGVTSWLNLASGGRLKVCHSDLPLSSCNTSLKEWEPFSGYLGPQKSNSSTHFDLLKKENHEKVGNCYKLSPIIKTLSYGHALKYLNLRSQGISKKRAIQLSQKKRCDLDDESQRTEALNIYDNDSYDELERRFQDFIQTHHIKDGEIVQKPEKLYDFIEKEKIKSKAWEKAKKGKIETDETIEKEIKTDEAEKLQSIDLYTKKTLTGILKDLIKKRKKRASHDQVIEKKTVVFDSEDLLKKNEVIEEVNKVNTDLDRDNPERKTVFKVVSLKPVGKPKRNEEVCCQGSPKSSENFEKSSKAAVSAEIKPETNQKFLEFIKNNSLINATAEKPEDIDPIALKNKNLLKKARAMKKIIETKIIKAKEKKIEIENQFKEARKKSFEEKIERLKEIELEKEQKYLENEEKIKKKSLRYLNKVEAMKQKKKYTLDREIDEIRKNYEERLQKAEENRNELIIKREKKTESDRNQYNSQRLFAELLRSMFKM